jgi:hypothetical protein
MEMSTFTIAPLRQLLLYTYISIWHYNLEIGILSATVIVEYLSLITVPLLSSH